MTSYLPAIVLVIFNAILPAILSFFARLQGTLRKSEIDRKTLEMFFIFTFFSTIILPSAAIGKFFFFLFFLVGSVCVSLTLSACVTCDSLS